MKKNIFKILLSSIFFILNCYAENKIISNTDIKNFISEISIKSNQILNNQELDNLQKEKEYRQFTDTIIDSNWVVKFILGNNWRTLNQQQKTEFQKLYKEYLLENYIPKLKDYSEGLIVNKVQKIKDKVYLVYTKTKDKEGRLVNVNFRVIEKNTNLYITDVIPEGISFISSQRTDVNNSISRNGYNKFIKELKQKIKNYNK